MQVNLHPRIVVTILLVNYVGADGQIQLSLIFLKVDTYFNFLKR